MEMFEPGVKISPEVGLTSETLGASTFEDVDPGTTVHGAAVPVLSWPGGARLALNIAVNVEEGAERSFQRDDGRNAPTDERCNGLVSDQIEV